jgi:hypothetical protein
LFVPCIAKRTPAGRAVVAANCRHRVILLEIQSAEWITVSQTWCQPAHMPVTNHGTRCYRRKMRTNCYNNRPPLAPPQNQQSQPSPPPPPPTPTHRSATRGYTQVHKTSVLLSCTVVQRLRASIFHHPVTMCPAGSEPSGANNYKLTQAKPHCRCLLPDPNNTLMTCVTKLMPTALPQHGVALNSCLSYLAPVGCLSSHCSMH